MVEKPRTLLHSLLPKRRETNQVEIPVSESIQDFFAGEAPARPLGQVPGTAFWIMEGRLIRIVHDLVVPKHSGKTDVEEVSHIIKVFVCQEQDPQKLYLSSKGADYR